MKVEFKLNNKAIKELEVDVFMEHELNTDGILDFLSKAKEAEVLLIDEDNYILGLINKENNYKLMSTLSLVNINKFRKIRNSLPETKEETPFYKVDLKDYVTELPVIEKIKIFQKTNELYKQPFDIEVAATNIIEELCESFDEKNARIIARNVVTNLFTGKNVTDDKKKLVDLFGDIIAFSIGELMKLEYDPEKVLDEVSKVINSRAGQIVEGKFVKYKDENNKSFWYEADFDKCKIRK